MRLTFCNPSDGPAHVRPASPLLELLHRPYTQRVFVHDNTAVGVPSLRADQGASARCYPERALLMAQPGDLVLVVDPVESAYLDYLESLGIGPGAHGVLPLGDGDDATSADGLLDIALRPAALQRIAERLDASREVRLGTYFPSGQAYRLARDLSRRVGVPVIVEGGAEEAVACANRKDRMRAEALHLGVPWPEGEQISLDDTPVCGDAVGAMLDAVHRLRTITGAALIRAVWSAHGVDNLKVTSESFDRAALEAWLAARPTQRRYLVESYLPFLTSPNIQVWVEDDEDEDVAMVAATAQRLSDSLAYLGNLHPYDSPLLPEMLDASRRVARRLGTLGYRGLLGLDFIETCCPRTGARGFALAEVNGRINGATYAVALSEWLNLQRCRLGRPELTCWRTHCRHFSRAVNFEAFAELAGDLLYHHGADAGVVPFNTGCLRYGYTYLLTIASSAEAAADIERRLAART